MLQELDIGDNDFDDEDVTHLTNSLANNCTLRCLDLSRNTEVTVSGWRAFAAVLQNPNSALERIHLDCNQINDDVMVSFANLLVHNNKLKDMFLDDDFDGVTVIGWNALSNVVCNKTSIDSTFNSNHTVQRIFMQESLQEYHLPSDLSNLLRINRRNTKFEAARRKILQVHFGGDFSMQPFIDMNLESLPHAIVWMARDEYGSSLLYKFVQNTTFFADVGGGGFG